MTTRTPSHPSNPASPPRDVEPHVIHAGFWRQMAALLLDSILIMSVAPVVGWMAFLMAMIVPMAMDARDGIMLAVIVASVAQWLVGVAYHALSDASAKQATLGKLALGIKLVDSSGACVSLKRATVRAMLQSPPFSIGYLLILLDRRKRGLHDLLTSTLVVDQWAGTAHPDRQSATSNRVTAWIGAPVVLVLMAVILVRPIQQWLIDVAPTDPQSDSVPVIEIVDPAPAELDESEVYIEAELATHGMTWGLGIAPGAPDVSVVSCHGQPFAPTRNGSCDAYVGDTACSSVLPVLCLRQDGRPAPEWSLRENWGEGEIALAPPVPGASFDRQADADAYCRSHLGAGWRLAEHHDGGGWQLHANGRIAPASRFWVANNDMPANCWNSEPRARTEASFRPGSDDAPQLAAREVRFSGAVTAFDTGCWADAACSVTVAHRVIHLPSPHPGRPDPVAGLVEGIDLEPGLIGKEVEAYCLLQRETCSLEGKADYYLRVQRTAATQDFRE